MRLERPRQAEQFLARQPVRELVQVSPSIVRYRLQRQVVDLARFQGDLRRTPAGALDRLGIRIDVQEAEQRQFVQVPEAVEEPAAQLEQRATTKAADSDN